MEAQPAGFSPVVAQPPRQPVHYQKPVAERTSGDLELLVREAAIVTTPVSESNPTPSTPRSDSNSLTLQSTLALAQSAAAHAARSRWLYVAPMTIVGVVALTLGALKGASMYDGKLDRQYAELTVASLAPDNPAPPGLPSTEDLDPPSDLEAVKIEPPPPQIVTPSGSAAEQAIAANQTPPPELETKALPSVANEPSRVNKPVSAPPMVAVTDQRGGENMVPRGLLTGAPQTVAPAPSPPSSAPAPARGSAVIKGETIKQVQPDYPAIARGARQEGAVPVEISINEKGDVVLRVRLRVRFCCGARRNPRPGNGSSSHQRETASLWRRPLRSPSVLSCRLRQERGGF